jgi:ABC-2 type transport system permease protein
LRFEIARKEFREIVRDRRFLVAGLILLILLATTLFTGWTQTQTRRRVQEAATAQTRQYWEAQGVKNPHSAAHFGIYAFKPAPPLSFADPGVDPYLGMAVWLEAHKQNPFVFPASENATGVEMLGEGSAASVLQLLAPLLIVLLCFSSFTAEREQGTLLQVLSLGVSPLHLWIGKAAGAGAALAILLIPAVALGAPLVVTYFLYFAVFLAVSLAASATAPNSRTALAVLLAFWTVSTVVIPKLAADISERLYPAPSNAEWWQTIESDMKHGVDGHDEASERTQRFKQEVLKRYGVERVEDLPVNFTGLSLLAGEEYGNTVFDRRFGELWERYRRQDRIHLAFGLISPLVAVRNLSMAVAGTDFAQHRRFALAAERYRRSLTRRMNEELAFKSRGNTMDYQAGPELWQRMPKFQYTPAGLAERLRGQWPSAALIAYWIAFAGAVALLSAGKVRA